MSIKKRESYIDVIKSAAIFSIISIHVCGAGILNAVGSSAWLGAFVWRCVCGAGVPLFFMCSGALMLSKEELPLKKLWAHYIARLLAALLVYAMMYKMWHLWEANDLSADSISFAVREVLLFRHQTHLYYMHIILLVYAFLPVTRVFVRKATQNELKYFLAVWFVLGIIYPTFRGFWPFTLLSGIPLQYLINMSYAAIGYGVLGYYLHKYPVKNSIAAVSAVIGIVFMFCGTWALTVRDRLETTVTSTFLEGMSLGVCLMAFGLYNLFRNADYKNDRIKNIAAFLSKASMFIYFMHMLVYFILQRLGLSVNLMTPWVSIPLMVLLILIICAALYIPVSKIPVIKDWLC